MTSGTLFHASQVQGSVRFGLPEVYQMVNQAQTLAAAAQAVAGPQGDRSLV